MPAISASAPGKIILTGEHAVVYGQPAIAIPVNQVSAKAIISADILGPQGRIHVFAPAIELDEDMDDLSEDNPIAKAVNLTLDALNIEHAPALKLKISSRIPVASGLGSGAAVSVAIIRALSTFLGHPLANEKISRLAFEVEKLHHGTPSGIDNTVVTFEKPVYFVKDQTVQTFEVGRAFQLVIADTGTSTPTRLVVEDVGAAWKKEAARYEKLFEAIGDVSEQAFQAIRDGETEMLGKLMDSNHSLLQDLGVSSGELDTMVEAARAAGAMGAKLSGGGRGGNMVALADEGSSEAVAKALAEAGAVNTIEATVQ